LAYHPDKNPGKLLDRTNFDLGDEDAASKFAQIARAYEVLSDETKR
jgi:DnaJ-class molecular chaperone